MNNMSEKIQKFILLMVGVLAMSLAIGYIVFAWVEPGAPPPGGNVPAPINVGSSDQIKAGGLTVKFLTASSTVNDKIILRGTQADPHTIWLGDNKGLRFWDSANGELMRITNTGKVSIGTSPAQKLTVLGGILAATGTPTCIPSDVGYSFIGDGCYDTGMFSTGDGVLKFYTNQIDTVTMTGGNVGIGTSPGYKLDVNGDINTSGVYRKGGTAGTSLSCGAAQVIKGATVSGGILTAGSCADDLTGGGGELYWVLSGSNLYTSSTAWNVGIGTTGPVEKLQVAGNVNIDNRLFVRSGSGWSGSPSISLAIGDNDTGLHWISDGNLAIYTNSAERVRIKSDGHVQFSGKIGTDGYSPNSGLPSGWGGGVHTYDLVAEASIAARQICIDTTGSGDGWTGLDCRTSWPSGIGGSGTANYVAKFTAATTIGNSQIYDDGTNVGIGTPGPRGKLDVRGNVLSYVESTGGILGSLSLEGKNSSASNPYLTRWTLYNMRNYSGINGLSIWEYYDANNNGSYCDDSGACNARVTISNGGNVGIGTTSPGEKLDVAGNIFLSTGQPYIRFLNTSNSTNRYIYNWTNRMAFTFPDSAVSGLTIEPVTGTVNISLNRDGSAYFAGNVGIGTTSPGAKLDVNGGILASGDIKTTGGIFDIPNTWDSQYKARGKRSIGGAQGWDANMLYINGFGDWTSGVSIGGGSASNLQVTGNLTVSGRVYGGGLKFADHIDVFDRGDVKNPWTFSNEDWGGSAEMDYINPAWYGPNVKWNCFFVVVPKFCYNSITGARWDADATVYFKFRNADTGAVTNEYSVTGFPGDNVDNRWYLYYEDCGSITSGKWQAWVKSGPISCGFGNSVADARLWKAILIAVVNTQ